MIASLPEFQYHPELRRLPELLRHSWRAPLLALAWLALACQSAPTALPAGSALEPLPRRQAVAPDDSERAVRDLLAAVLGGGPSAVQQGVSQVEAREAERIAAGEPPSGLVPYAIDAAHSTLPSGPPRREAAARLLERDDLDPILRARVLQDVEDDPLVLAELRLREARVRRFGRATNTLMGTIGRSLSNTALLPYRAFQALMRVALTEYQEDELTAPERQALVHWKRFVERHPEAPEAAALLERIEESQSRWLQTQRDRNLRDGRRALDDGDPRLASNHAARALRYAPEDPQASALLRESEARVAVWLADRRRTLEIDPRASAVTLEERALLVQLLIPGGDVQGTASALQAASSVPATRAEAAFALALAASERGETEAAWEELESLAREPVPMARHAQALVSSPETNPFGTFEVTRRAARNARLRGIALGPLRDGARRRDLPRPVEWLIEIPSVLGVVGGLPGRLLQAPFQSTDNEVPAVLARRYLERHPEGVHASELQQWLQNFEGGRGNHVGALRLAEAAGETSGVGLKRLRELAGRQAYDASLKEKRRNVRLQLLTETARTFEGTEGAKLAGLRAREEFRQASPQRIRISKGFLLENPSVAGPQGLAMISALLDEEPDNGELHPEGVSLLGGRFIEFAFLAESGDPEDEPRREQQKISEERLARLVAQLEESTQRTLRTDRDARVEHDADRDLFFERARLGLTEQIDRRSSAESSYSFTGMRERYGLVRSRESILPVELVLQGSFEDFGLGAFPRIRMPKPTPDQPLYR